MTATPINLIFGPGQVIAASPSSGSMSGQQLNDADNAVGWVFNVPKSGSITKIGVYCTAETGTSPAYNAGIVTVDGSGDPTVTAYGGATNGTITFTAEGMYWLTLPAPATATAGEWAAVRVWPTASAPDGSNYASVLISIPWIGHGRAGYYTTGWTFASGGRGPNFAIEYSDGSIFGFAPASRTNTVLLRSDTTPDEYGNKFTSPSAMTVIGISCCHYNGMGSSSALTVTLYDSGDNVLASTAISDKDFVNDTEQITAFFAPVTLAAGQIYRITITATVSGSGGSIYPSRFIFDSAAAKDAMPGAVGHVATYRTDAGAWTDTTAEVAAIGLIVTAIEFGSTGSSGGQFAYIG